MFFFVFIEPKFISMRKDYDVHGKVLKSGFTLEFILNKRKSQHQLKILFLTKTKVILCVILTLSF